MSLIADTKEADRVTWREKIGLGLGKVAADGSLGTIHLLVSPIYNMTLGLSPALVSTALFVQRIWDAMLDPVCGQFSDNFRSRWGRRLPLMLSAVPFVAGLFAVLWWFPRGASENHLFLHLLGFSLLFYIAHSIYAMALGGLILEATGDYHERTRVAAVTLAFGFAFLVGSQWLYPLTQHSLFGGDTITGLRWVGTGCAIAFLVAGLLPTLICRERNYTLVAHGPRSSFRESLRAVRENKPFMILLAARFVSVFGYSLVGIFFLYMNNYYVFGGDLRKAAFALGILGSSFQVAAIVSSIFIFPRLARRLGKRRVFQISAGILMAGCVAKLFVYQPDQPWLQFVVLISNGTSTAGMLLMTSSMLGDISDYDEWRTGQRREALFVAVSNWFDKAANSVGSLITGFLLVWIGFDAKFGAQPGRTLELMKLCYFLAPFLGAMLALILIQRYRLDEQQVYQIKADLAARRPAVK